MDARPVRQFRQVRLLVANWRVRDDWMSEESQLPTVRQDEFDA